MNFKPILNRFEYLNWQEIDSIAKEKDQPDLAIAVEQHGPHLPLATDSIFVDEIIAKYLNYSFRYSIKKNFQQYIGFSPEHKVLQGQFHSSQI